MAIPRNFSYSSQVLELDNVVVVVGEYYYNNKTREIERRSNKRKRGEYSLSQEYFERNIKWKAGQTLRKMKYIIASSLNAFAGANAMSVYELGEALDISRARVVELEGALNTIKDSLDDEFRKEANTAEQLHKEEMQKDLQLQKDKLNAEFEKRDSINHRLHQEELEALKLTHSQEIEQLKMKHAQEMASLQEECLEVRKYNEKLEHKVLKLEQDNWVLENTIEENQQGTLILETIKEEARAANEELMIVQK
jgi:hypothetical protein